MGCLRWSCTRPFKGGFGFSGDAGCVLFSRKIFACWTFSTCSYLSSFFAFSPV